MPGTLAAALAQAKRATHASVLRPSIIIMDRDRQR
jgi:hypothetical protein